MTPGPLERVCLENRKTLAMQQVGGAVAHVDVVELLGLDGLTALENAGFTADVEWTVAGSVTHFGHRHLRQNVYAARLEIVPVDGAWKIRAFELASTERRR